MEIIRHAKLAAVNVHASLLPKYRGAAPLRYALFDGEASSGVTIMHMSRRLDSGDIIRQAGVAIDENMNYGVLHNLTATLGADLLLLALDDLASKTATRSVQEHEGATYAPKLTPGDQMIDWQRPAAKLHNRVRALDPEPGAETFLDGMRIKIWRTQNSDFLADGLPGSITANKDGVFVSCGSGSLQLIEVQPAGKKRLLATDWWRGLRLTAPRFLVNTDE